MKAEPMRARPTRSQGASSETIIPGSHNGGKPLPGGTGGRSALIVDNAATNAQMKKRAETI
jgi:hypothetical protein